jgi:hypothetical protein
VLWMAAWVERKHCTELADLNPCILRSRRRTTWCEFSARLFLRRPCSWRGQTEVSSCASIGRQLVRHQHVRTIALPLQKLAHELQSSRPVPTWLNEHVQDLALAVDRSPAIHPFSLERDCHLDQVLDTCGSRSQTAQVVGKGWSKLENPPADGLVRDLQTPLG